MSLGLLHGPVSQRNRAGESAESANGVLAGSRICFPILHAGYRIRRDGRLFRQIMVIVRKSDNGASRALESADGSSRAIDSTSAKSGVEVAVSDFACVDDAALELLRKS